MHRYWKASVATGALFSWPVWASGAAFSTGPIPPYTANVIETDGIDTNSSTIGTHDKVATVVNWYQLHLPKGTTSSPPDADGGRIFYLPGGATVDIERDGPNTMIGMTWQKRH